jgi:hypothetical protein
MTVMERASNQYMKRTFQQGCIGYHWWDSTVTAAVCFHINFKSLEERFKIEKEKYKRLQN